MEERAAIEIKILKLILDSLCTRELSNKGKHFIQNLIKERGGNYTR